MREYAFLDKNDIVIEIKWIDPTDEFPPNSSAISIGDVRPEVGWRFNSETNEFEAN